MTGKELFENLNGTNKKTDYLEKLLGFEVEKIEKTETKELDCVETEFRDKDNSYEIEDDESWQNYQKLWGYSEFKSTIDAGFVIQKRKKESVRTYFLIYLTDFLCFYLYEAKETILIYSGQYMNKLGRSLNLVEKSAHFKTVEEFKTFLEGILK